MAGKRTAFWLAWFLAGLGLWLLLVFKTELAEIVAGAIAAALAATGAELVRSKGFAPFWPALRWWRAPLRLPREVVVDTWRMARLLWLHFVHGEPVRGSFRILHFEDCGGEGPRDQARRALAKWLGSVSPNNYILGFDERRDVAVVHQLVPTDELPTIDPER